ncbi:MAG TPA: hydantoinase B/oxoprolinase family protein [Ramlibacter sp.]|nr:hydantoinase B/oxoprolinase family protein [Ramlibacter sp.]
MTKQPPRQLSPIASEIIQHALLAIPKQIEANIARTAFSPLVYAYKDYAVGLVDCEGRLICESQGGIPLFVANALGPGVRDGIAIHGLENIRHGDVFISNHAGTLGQHLNNVVMYTPVFLGSGELIGFMAVLMHWVDIGGMVIGSAASVGTTEIYQEGIQFRSVKLWSAGKPNDDIVRIIEINTRFKHMLMGDIQSQLAGCLLGRDLFAAMIAKYTWEDVRSTIDLMWKRSEEKTRAAIRTIADGTYSAESFLDNDGYELDKPVRIHACVTVKGDEMVVDFSGCAEQVKGSINSGREGGAVTAARIALNLLIGAHDACNDGTFRPLRVEIPNGKFISANGEAAMSMYSPPLATVIDTVLKALEKAAPELIAGGHHGNFNMNQFMGRHPKTGELFQTAGSGGIGGWGASRGHDGPGPYKTMAHGDTWALPVEQEEALYPVRVESYAVRPDSGGAGEFRGGLGYEKVISALADCKVQTNFDRTISPPWGILGGQDGATPSVTIESDGKEPRLAMKVIAPIATGERLRTRTSGGGGYGSPLDREPGRVARDVCMGYVTVAAASDVYGVVLDAVGGVDAKKTAARRESLRDKQGAAA